MSMGNQEKGLREQLAIALEVAKRLGPLNEQEIAEVGARWAFEKAAKECERIGDVWVVKGALDMQPMDGEYAKNIRSLASQLAPPKEPSRG